MLITAKTQWLVLVMITVNCKLALGHPKKARLKTRLKPQVLNPPVIERRSTEAGQE
jgi:hypothetical protein